MLPAGGGPYRHPHELSFRNHFVRLPVHRFTRSTAVAGLEHPMLAGEIQLSNTSRLAISRRPWSLTA
jgi:hypothetical protein